MLIITEATFGITVGEVHLITEDVHLPLDEDLDEDHEMTEEEEDENVDNLDVVTQKEKTDGQKA